MNVDKRVHALIAWTLGTKCSIVSFKRNEKRILLNQIQVEIDKKLDISTDLSVDTL